MAFQILGIVVQFSVCPNSKMVFEQGGKADNIFLTRKKSEKHFTLDFFFFTGLVVKKDK